ncbi:MAG TPA: diguanylate cyclase [Rhodocyclaceae bacterium]|nr:diguanylate cyclase [Rhodocyclaceae bacterium]
MPDFTQPADIARETLRRLAIRKTPPTPDNYRMLYNEITGVQTAEPFPERSLKAVHAALPRATSDQTRFARQMENAIAGSSWEGLRAALTDLLNRSKGDPLPWPALIRELLLQLDIHHTGLTSARKKESLDHVLSSASASPDLLFSRVQSIMRSWAQNPIDKTEELAPHPGDLEPAKSSQSETAASSGQREPTPMTPWRGGLGELQQLISQLMENTLPLVLMDHADLVREATEIAAAVRRANGAEELVGLTERLKKISYRAHFIAEDQAELRTALLHLIRLIMENISELVVDDQWLTGQVSIVRDLVKGPLNLRRLDDVERRMKDVIVKQSSLKKNLSEAKDRLKLMLATFVDRLADFSETTTGYHDKIEKYAEKISKANDIAELSDVLDEVLRETRVVQLNAARSRDELSTMRSRVDDAEREINRLQNELASASELVRIDSLTGALNRKGMADALEGEVARARRQHSKLCLAMLDIDNFKKLNDNLGHAVGDAALVHLSKVVQETIRPEDILARYGGEEFVVLLPNTPLENATIAMVRVQRELTRRFFLNNNNKVLITFSCGVAEMSENEDPFEALKRADEAMYLAKRAGKNRVVPA